MRSKKGEKGKLPRHKDEPQAKIPTSASKEFYSLVPDDIEKLKIGPPEKNIYLLRVYASFDYPPLPGPNYIRLLHLEPPGKDPSKLTGYLKAHNLDDKPDYEAISYAWGDHPEFNRAIHMNGQVLRITGNLCAALMAYSYANRTRVLWADAICINQADNAEKTQQVAIMADIYSRAKIVQVWLAPASEATEAAMRFLEALSKRANSLGVDEKVDQPRFVPDFPSVKMSDEDALPLICGAIAAHVDYLLFRSWFNRVWVIQEVTLATKLVVSCGHEHLDWTSFARAVEALRGAVRQVPQGDERLRMDGIKSAWELVRLRDSFRLFYQPDSQNHHIMTNLVGRQMSNKMCSDDRDRVYAMLAMTKSPYGMKPDYDKTVEEAYTEFTRRYSPNTQIYWTGLSRRQHAETSTNKNNNTKKDEDGIIDLTDRHYLPSWVPEFRTSRNLAWASPFNGTYSTALATPFYFFPHPEMTNVLGVTGTLFGMIGPVTYDYRASSAPYCMHELGFYFSLIAQLQNIPFPTHKSEEQPYSEPLWLVLAKTLTGGVSECPGAEFLLSRYRTFESLESLGVGSLAWLTAIWATFAAECFSPTGEVYQYVLLKSLGAKPLPPLSTNGEIATGFLCYLANILVPNRLFVTSNGYLGLSSADVKGGDFIAIFNGCHMPYLVRSAGKVKYKDKVLEGALQVLGLCYVHGIMKGELAEKRNERRFREFKWTKHDGDKVDSLEGWLMLV